MRGGVEGGRKGAGLRGKGAKRDEYSYPAWAARVCDDRTRPARRDSGERREAGLRELEQGRAQETESVEMMAAMMEATPQGEGRGAALSCCIAVHR